MTRRHPPRAPIDPSAPVEIPRRHWIRLILSILAALVLGGSGTASPSPSPSAEDVEGPGQAGQAIGKSL